MGYNEALVFQKEGAGNPVKGVFISLNSDGTIREPDRKNALEVLQKHPHLKLYLYDREKAKDGHIVKVFSHDEAMKIVGTQLEAGQKWDWSRMRNLVDEDRIAQDATVPAQTIGDRMSQFIVQKGCGAFFEEFAKLDLQKQKNLFEYVWGSTRTLDGILEPTGGSLVPLGLAAVYEGLKTEFVTLDGSIPEQQIFNDEMRNKMLQVMAQQEGRQKFVAGYRKALGDYDGTFFDDAAQYDVVKAEMLEFIFKDKMPRRVLISDYVASIPDNALSLIEALQYAWNVGGDDKFNFEDLKNSCGITDATDLPTRISFSNSVKEALVSKIESLSPGFKDSYDKVVPAVISVNDFSEVRRGVINFLDEVTRVRVASTTNVAVTANVIEASSDPTSLAAAAVDDSAVDPAGYEFMIAAETLEKVRRYKGSLQPPGAGDPKIGVYLAFNILKSKGMLPAGINEDYFRYTGGTKADKSKTLGDYLRRQAQDLVSSMSTEEFLELLIQTKKPKFFAESAIKADASLDWNDEEISILGDVNCAVDVTIYDNGRHKLEKASDVHNDPFAGSLLFSPGALLEGKGGKVDIAEVVEDGNVSQEKLSALYERRLLPLLLHANRDAEKNSRKAFVTIPGMGCGCFAGDYVEQIKPKFKAAIMAVIDNNQDKLTNIAGVYLDLYDNEYLNEEKTLGATKFISRVLTTADGSGRPQLCHPSQYGDEFKDCKLYSVVAWDHVSWPGNDYYPGQRSTDDGVKAAATDSMTKFTGMPGQYVSNPNSVGSTMGYESTNGSIWLKCIEERQVDLKVKGNVAVLEGGDLKRLTGEVTTDRDGGAPQREEAQQERDLQLKAREAERERQLKAQLDAEARKAQQEKAQQAKLIAQREEIARREKAQQEREQRDAEEKAQRDAKLKARREEVRREKAQLAKARQERVEEWSQDQRRISSQGPGAYESNPSETSSEFSSSESDFFGANFSDQIADQIRASDLSLQDSDEKRVTNQLFAKNVQAQPYLLEQYEKLAPKDGSQNLYSRLLAEVVPNPDQALQRINLRNLAATLSAAARYFDTEEDKAGRMALANRSSIKFICDKLFGGDLDKGGLKDGQMQNYIKNSLSEKLKIEPGKLQDYLFEKAAEVRAWEKDARPATSVAKIDISKLLNQNVDRSV